MLTREALLLGLVLVFVPLTIAIVVLMPSLALAHHCSTLTVTSSFLRRRLR